ncbi:hypothetical protein [Candidatus Finniella inopinata]|uniref:Single Cache domain-containing protein n=1 Tax=Candidatus Finniella inopinata TaxID=1696036 RepID=A0A4Q7DK52_9PROT|nr:hypothetical protein [Candidatus Finniella inopinata]RZI46565.1 hypothetical protein EQU50_02975 [Candidatus Finniella inopinata]
MSKISKIFLVIVSLFICEQAGASTKQKIVEEANKRFEELSNIIQTKGPETIINSINTDQEKNYQNYPIKPVVLGDATNGGPLIWVEDGKVIAASSDRSELNKDVSKDTVVLQIVEALKNNADEKVVVSYDGGKKTAVAWGRKALLGKQFNKDLRMKFFCYVTFDNPGT